MTLYGLREKKSIFHLQGQIVNDVELIRKWKEKDASALRTMNASGGVFPFR